MISEMLTFAIGLLAGFALGAYTVIRSGDLRNKDDWVRLEE